MSKTILVVGFACMSVIAIAQSSSTGKASNDAAPGQAMGRRMHQPLTMKAAQKNSSSTNANKPCGQLTAQTCTPSPAVAPPPSGNKNSRGIQVTKSTDVSSTK